MVEGQAADEARGAPADGIPHARGRSGSRVLVAGLAIIVVASLVIWVALPKGPTPSPSGTFVLVTATNWEFEGESACWVNASAPGGTVAAGSEFPLHYYLGPEINPPSSSCTVERAAVEPAGFALVNDNAPVVILKSGSGVFFLNITAPAAAYTGNLTIEVTVSSP